MNLGEAVDDIKDAVRQHILTRHLPGERPEHIRNDTPLQSSGVLDSLALLDVISFVETRFGVELDVYDTGADRFDTLQQIEHVVMTKTTPTQALAR